MKDRVIVNGRWLFIILCFLADNSFAQRPPRQRILLDSGWRFQSCDPVDVTTNVTYYPEISVLPPMRGRTFRLF